MKNIMVVSVICVLAFSVGYWMRPDIGMGVYFEDGRLVIDGGRHQGFVFNGNIVDITLPEWIESKLFPDDFWRNVDVRNFHFDYSNCKPNIVVLPNEPNRTIVVEGSLPTKKFIKPSEGEVDCDSNGIHIVDPIFYQSLNETDYKNVKCQ